MNKNIIIAICGTIFLFFLFIIYSLNKEENQKLAEASAEEAYAKSRGGTVVKATGSYDYFSGSSYYSNGSYTRYVELQGEDISFKCIFDRNVNFDRPFYVKDIRDNTEIGDPNNDDTYRGPGFQNTPTNRAALIQCSDIDYVDQFEYAMKRAKILYLECGNNASQACYQNKFLPKISGLDKPLFSYESINEKIAFKKQFIEQLK